MSEIFVKIEGIEGESKDVKHKGAIAPPASSRIESSFNDRGMIV